VNAETTNAVISSNYSVRNGLFHFHISGFTYSAPTIRVSLFNTSSTGEDEPLISVAKQTKGKKSFTCVNKKTKASIRIKKGNCPKGYKRA
jgi:hypothetical protein